MEGQKYHGDTIPEPMVIKDDMPVFKITKKWLDR
jgi:methylated-DNA-[protein]-cysteine S-methyltransferase